MPKDLIAKCKR